MDAALFAAEEASFGSPVDLLILPDHYVVRMLYSQGIPLESIGVPRLDGRPVEKDHRKIWKIFAENFYLFRVEPDARVVFHRVNTGAIERDVPIVALAGATVTATSRSLLGHFVAAATGDGRVALLQVRFTPQYEDQKLVDLGTDVRERGLVELDLAGRPNRLVSYAEQEGQKFVAGAVADDEIALWWTDADGVEHRASVTVTAPQVVTHVRIGRNGAVIAGTDRGRVSHWDLQPGELQLTDVSPVSKRAITSLEWVLRGNSFVAGSADGGLSSWFQYGDYGSGAALTQTLAYTTSLSTVGVVSNTVSKVEYVNAGWGVGMGKDTVPFQDWSSYDGFRVWFKGTNSGVVFKLILTDNGVTKSSSKLVRVGWELFIEPWIRKTSKS